MSEALSVLEGVVIGGDLAALTAEQRLEWYRTRCEAAGLDPRAQPFQYINLQGRLTLYATKAATDQLAKNHALNVEILSREMTEGDIYEVVCRVRAGGRVTEDVGAVYVGGLKGEALVNARLKAISKAKRRTTLAHCGLGMIDESEAESLPGAARVHVNESGEIMGELPAATEPVHDLAYWRRRSFALYADLGGDPSDRDACRKDFADILGLEVQSRKELVQSDWERIALHLQSEKDRIDNIHVLQASAAEVQPVEQAGAPDVPQTAPGWKERTLEKMQNAEKQESFANAQMRGA